tara:strand:+ start:156 stop:749 length:594 start_codon:yes stop_codon:yes gene_type:complete
MNKFKEGDEIVRTKIECKSAPIGYKTIIEVGTLSRKLLYPNIYGRLASVNEDDWELAEDTSKPVYTQEMHDNNELPAVGMYFNCSDEVNYDTRIDDFKGKEVEVIAVSDFFGKKVITFYHSTKGLGCGNFLKSWVHPITPAPIELIDGNAYMFDYHKNRKPVIGVYSKSNETFLTVSDDHFAFNCTNIRPMTVTESK